MKLKAAIIWKKEGFVRSIYFINNKGIKIEQIITDRHVQIVKHIREEMPNTKQYFDVWHVAKGKFIFLKMPTKFSSYLVICKIVTSLKNLGFFQA